MQYDITLSPSGVRFSSQDNLLDDALSQEITLEHSCKNGDCGVCEAKVISGEVLNELGEKVHSGTILTCQSKAISDLVLEAEFYPELSAIKQQTLPCKVSNITFPTEDILIIKFRFPPTANFIFRPGQYLDLIFKGVKRSYSIANAMVDSQELELHIRKVPKGKMSDLLFNDLKANQLMRIEGPKGTFFVRASNRPIVFLATGTGIAPVKAMVEQLIHDNDKRDVAIYWGMRTPDEIYDEAFIKLLKGNKHIRFIPVLSRSPEWGGRVGYVQNAVIEDIANLEPYDVYACGSLSMIEAAKALFSDHNLPLKHFHSDAFTPAK
ncbi:FAD-binding oxidoreductase [Vibrio sp. Isolate23]|uniref:FAD-binding oxidoreductase n=1 Tax=Vibrio sp. Isolate23 TaxID=2908533 RepID=UPI001EFD27F7|nr:FAD-binding oxidoreductase [Vibrio sp. Isolate23]MCG9683904.1 FAD-binding oxidoreductase [Vibrio sp. Isolate23]